MIQLCLTRNRCFFACVRFVKNENLMEEFLFAKELETHTAGESVFQLVVDFFNEKEIPLINIVFCATDGAPSMLGYHRGFIKYLKEAVPGVATDDAPSCEVPSRRRTIKPPAWQKDYYMF